MTLLINLVNRQCFVLIYLLIKMKIIEPSVKEIKDFEGVDNFYKSVARAARICYASDKTTDDKELCERLIKSGHYSPFEHAIIYLWNNEVMKYTGEKYMWLQYIFFGCLDSKYTVHRYYGDGINDTLFTINGRIIVELAEEYHQNNPDTPTIVIIDGFLEQAKQVVKYIQLPEIPLPEPVFKSFIVDTSIGCTREMNRHHDNFYICEQSTRYCNFSKDKFDNEVTFNEPYWYDDTNYKLKHSWMCAMRDAEFYYLDNIKRGVPTDIARGILPLDTHTRAIYTATIEEWQHIIDLRLKGTTGKPHGDIKIIAEKINNLINDEKD